MLPQLGLVEMLIVMGLAVLLFGKRLPEVGRSLGRGIIEFKKGLNGMSDEMDMGSSSGAMSSYSSSYGSSSRYDEKPLDPVYSDTAVPKFELPGVSSAPASQPEQPQRTASD